MPTTSDYAYATSVSLIPTTEFLDKIARSQWATENEYYVGFSPVELDFFANSSSEVICLNLEADLLSSGYSDIKIKNPFAYSRPESSPVLSVYQSSRYLAPSQKPNSIFLYRLTESKNKEIILASNCDKNPTEAPPLDCFSRECLSWFNSETDYFIGFGSYTEGIATIAEGDSIAVSALSNEILEGIIDFSISSISHTSIQVVDTVSPITPYVKIQFCTSAEYTLSETSPNPNFMLLYGIGSTGDSLVSFVYDFKGNATEDILFGEVTVQVSWNPEDIVII